MGNVWKERGSERRAVRAMVKYLSTDATWPLKKAAVSDTSVINVGRSDGREKMEENTQTDLTRKNRPLL